MAQKVGNHRHATAYLLATQTEADASTYLKAKEKGRFKYKHKANKQQSQCVHYKPCAIDAYVCVFA
jgi:hypothetical protein